MVSTPKDEICLFKTLNFDGTEPLYMSYPLGFDEYDDNFLDFVDEIISCAAEECVDKFLNNIRSVHDDFKVVYDIEPEYYYDQANLYYSMHIILTLVFENTNALNKFKIKYPTIYTSITRLNVICPTS